MKYHSKFGSDRLLTGSQYIAELVVEREAIFKKVKLPDKFWSLPQWQYWKKRFLGQKRQADAFIKAGYSVEAILNTLKSKKFQKCWSLFNKELDFYIHEEQRKLETTKQVIEEEKQLNITETDIELKNNKFGKTTKLGKLRD